MATIRSAIQITDGMTPALRAMQRSLNLVISSFENLQGQTSQAVDVNSLRAAREELNRAEAEFNQIDEAIDRARQSQEQFNNQVDRSANLMNTVKRAATGIGAAIGVKKIIETSDALSSTKARLDLMNDGLMDTAQLQDAIYRSAQRSRTAYSDTANAVAKLGILAKDAFDSNAEIVQFAELMNKQFKIGGASIQEQTSAMYQLTQAMAAGKLQGDEFRSIMENAPMLAQAIAKYMGMSVGELKEMSSEGLITADVIKNAMFASAEATNAKFKELPMTFGQVWTEITNSVIKGLEPTLIAMGQGAKFIHDNWSNISPVILAAATAMGIYATATGIQTAATWLNVAANRALIATMLTNPIMWIALLVGVLIGALYKWVQANGGVEISLLKLKNIALNAWDAMKIGAVSFGIGVVDAIGDMRVKVQTLMQNMVNGAIDMINKLIDTVNKIPGVSIGSIQQVTFASEAAVQNEAEKQARGQFLADMKLNSDIDQKLRENQIANLVSRKQAENSTQEVSMPAIEAYAGSIDANTSDIKDSVSMTAEDLKYMRDLAEQEVVNRFTTAEIKVDMANSFGDIRETADLDGVVAYLEDRLTETLNIVAEGAPADV